MNDFDPGYEHARHYHMRVIIAGSRHRFCSKEWAIKCIDGAMNQVPAGIDDIRVVSGCSGWIDYCGIMWAKENDIQIDPFPYLSWLGKSGGPIRNKIMAQDADYLILIWDGKSKGSANMKFWGEKFNLTIFEFTP